MATTILEIYNGHKITTTDGMLNLTDMWRATGEARQNPYEWLRIDETITLQNALKENPKYGSDPHLKSKRGNGGGTLAHKIIGLAYAKYLSPEFHIWCNEILLTSEFITDGMLNLTDMWKATGDNPSSRPSDFLKLPKTDELIKALASKKIDEGWLDEPKVGIIPTLTNIKKGRYGGTFAHPIIGLAYAKYLSPEFHIWCNEILLAVKIYSKIVIYTRLL